ncbi:hypothetical protein T4B_7571, partial [Trichinella pseudospiralis]
LLYLTLTGFPPNIGTQHQYHDGGGTDQRTEISISTSNGIRTSGRLHADCYEIILLFIND